ncbi:prolyl oligopeptidase family serine peptidase [Streptomyces sp. WMMC500]|uniref:alpha/beta hydrolase n=1 Tax=Streptomyces sp. WMMC500 TaxID=3015154 RepID=UPI00248B7B98|nr:alpha/beta hydrolase fold domain-containing protein [Streptomyces sp. WMMC500]WBB60111.1 prolyl oligopeptidase family serine peptidase [Streptomyces sp. WMMC500]
MRITPAAAAVTSLLAAGLGAGAAAVAAGRYGSRAALRPAPAGPVGFGGARLRVIAAADGRVTLAPGSAPALRPERYGLAGDGVHAVVGPLLRAESWPGGRLVRSLERVTYGSLDAGTRVRLTPKVYTGTPATALRIAYEDVTVEGPLGPLPAWYVPGSRGTWVIAVHGLGDTREQALTALPLLHELGLPVLAPAYRGDPDAPPPPGGRGALGHAEWPDLDAALRWALRRGARRVVLYGWSAGATMALRTAAESPAADGIAGLVLDSPLLDWRAAVRALAGRSGAPGRLALPAPLRGLAVLAAEEYRELDAALAVPDAPTLVLQGRADDVAPLAAARAFAARGGDRLLLREVPDGRHAALWNATPEAYEETLRRFLTPLL